MKQSVVKALAVVLPAGFLLVAAGWAASAPEVIAGASGQQAHVTLTLEGLRPLSRELHLRAESHFGGSSSSIGLGCTFDFLDSPGKFVHGVTRTLKGLEVTLAHPGACTNRPPASLVLAGQTIEIVFAADRDAAGR